MDIIRSEEWFFFQKCPPARSHKAHFLNSVVQPLSNTWKLTKPSPPTQFLVFIQVPPGGKLQFLDCN